MPVLSPTSNPLKAGNVGDTVYLPIYKPDGFTPDDLSLLTLSALKLRNPQTGVTVATAAPIALAQQQVVNAKDETLPTWCVQLTTDGTHAFPVGGDWQYAAVFTGTGIQSETRTGAITIEPAL